jgi:hypothetical protein
MVASLERRRMNAVVAIRDGADLFLTHRFGIDQGLEYFRQSLSSGFFRIGRFPPIRICRNMLVALLPTQTHWVTVQNFTSCGRPKIFSKPHVSCIANTQQLISCLMMQLYPYHVKPCSRLDATFSNLRRPTLSPESNPNIL